MSQTVNKVFEVKMSREPNGRFIKGQYEYRGKTFRKVSSQFSSTGLYFRIGRFTFETEAAIKTHIDGTMKGW